MGLAQLANWIKFQVQSKQLLLFSTTIVSRDKSEIQF